MRIRTPPIIMLQGQPTKMLVSIYLISIEIKQRPGKNSKNFRPHHFSSTLSWDNPPPSKLWGFYSPSFHFFISINSPVLLILLDPEVHSLASWDKNLELQPSLWLNTWASKVKWRLSVLHKSLFHMGTWLKLMIQSNNSQTFLQNVRLFL
jgi:hypothetical protein